MHTIETVLKSKLPKDGHASRITLLLLKAVSVRQSQPPLLAHDIRVAPREPGPPPPPDRARTSHATDRSLSFSPALSVSLHHLVT